MKHVFLSLFGENGNVIQIDYHAVANQTLKGYIHRPLESCSSINETKRNYSVGKSPPLRTKYGLHPILFCYQDLVVAWKPV